MTVIKKADNKYIVDEEEQFLGKEVGDMFVEIDEHLAGYESIKVELMSPSDPDSAYEDWVNSSFYNSLATWDRAPYDIVSDMHKNLSFEEKEKMLFKILDERPISVALEAAVFNYKITGIPRSMTAQICRHRSMAFGEMSMRVASAYSEKVRVPQSLLDEKASPKTFELLRDYERVVKECKKVYKDLIIAGIPMEQARNILPLGICTKIGVTTRLRFLIDYIRGRTSGITQDEHTYIVALLLKELKEKQPRFFAVITKKCSNAEDIMNQYLKNE